MASEPIKIIKGATLPPPPLSQRWPFNAMKVGDAFDAPLVARPSLSTICAQRKRSKGESYTVRKIDEQTIRIWRLS